MVQMMSVKQLEQGLASKLALRIMALVLECLVIWSGWDWVQEMA